MKRNKLLYLSILPVLALTSCNSDMTKVSYDNAYEYALEHFNPNALDSISSSTNYNLNELGVDLDVLSKGKEGEVETSEFKVAFNGVSATLQDTFAEVLSTHVLESVYQYYTTFVSFAKSVQFITNIPVDLNFYEIKGGGMRVGVESNGLQNSIYNLLNIVVTAFNVPQVRLPIIGKLMESLGSSMSSYILLVENFFENNAVGFDPINSGSSNDKFDLYCITDNNGYILDKGLKAYSDVDVVFTVSTYEEPWIPDKKQTPPAIASTRDYYVDGHIGLDFDIKTNLNI